MQKLLSIGFAVILSLLSVLGQYSGTESSDKNPGKEETSGISSGQADEGVRSGDPSGSVRELDITPFSEEEYDEIKSAYILYRSIVEPEECTYDIRLIGRGDFGTAVYINWYRPNMNPSSTGTNACERIGHILFVNVSDAPSVGYHFWIYKDSEFKRISAEYGSGNLSDEDIEAIAAAWYGEKTAFARLCTDGYADEIAKQLLFGEGSTFSPSGIRVGRIEEALEGRSVGPMVAAIHYRGDTPKTFENKTYSIVNPDYPGYSLMVGFSMLLLETPEGWFALSIHKDGENPDINKLVYVLLQEQYRQAASEMGIEEEQDPEGVYSLYADMDHDGIQETVKVSSEDGVAFVDVYYADGTSERSYNHFRTCGEGQTFFIGRLEDGDCLISCSDTMLDSRYDREFRGSDWDGTVSRTEKIPTPNRPRQGCITIEYSYIHHLFDRPDFLKTEAFQWEILDGELHVGVIDYSYEVSVRDDDAAADRYLELAQELLPGAVFLCSVKDGVVTIGSPDPDAYTDAEQCFRGLQKFYDLFGRYDPEISDESIPFSERISHLKEAVKENYKPEDDEDLPVPDWWNDPEMVIKGRAINKNVH